MLHRKVSQPTIKSNDIFQHLPQAGADIDHIGRFAHAALEIYEGDYLCWQNLLLSRSIFLFSRPVSILQK